MMVAAGLLAGCAEADLVDDGTGEGYGADEGDGSEDETGEGTGGGEDGGGEYMPPDHDDDPDLDPDPSGRIIWVGDVEGDLMVHATLGAEVAADYPEGVMYQLRFDTDGQAMYAQIVDAEDEVLDLVRVAERAPVMYPSEEETVLSVCYPWPFMPPIVANCFVAPCPWDDGWPGQGAPWPNCVEVSQSSGLVRVVGSIDGTPMGQELTQDGDPVPMFDTPFTLAQTQRVETVSDIANDIARLGTELEELEVHAIDCQVLGSYVTSRAVSCGILNWQACSDAYWGYALYSYQCKGQG